MIINEVAVAKRFVTATLVLIKLLSSWFFKNRIDGLTLTHRIAFQIDTRAFHQYSLTYKTF